MQTILDILKMAGGFRPNLYLKIENAPYMALVIEAIAGLRNPFGVRFVFESALAASAGGQCALLFLVYYVPKTISPGPNRQPVSRSYAWIIASAMLALIFILVLGPGVQLHG